MSDTTAFACIHGHFYQPPRENPWLDAIEIQDSAAPYHDWNERIAAECYAPNADSRVLDDRGRILRIVNNYSRISFNVGPTLAGWLAGHDPATHEAIVAADRESAARFGGHGSAMAQVFNHSILPLASARDRRTQIRWGLTDFEHRFGRAAEGIWLPETAADTDTLEALAEAGLRFTVLSPLQAAAVRPLGARSWTDVRGGAIDGTRPYRAVLPSGRELALFFYDAPLSRAVAFEGALHDGRGFGRRIAQDARRAGRGALVHLATDGESYGHHHRHGDMALAVALDELERLPGVRLTNYGESLDRTPPQSEVRLVEPSSWSCAHGVGRWQRDCGCRAGGGAGWHQRWRAPLRAALDALRERLDPLYEAQAAGLLRDPWAARDAHVELELDRGDLARGAFVERHATRALEADELLRVLRLLEMQRHAQLMYTSCGWFFDEVSGIETVQILRYAARAIELAEQVGGSPIEPWFRERLREVPSNLDELGDGDGVWRAHVVPARVDGAGVALDIAAAELFDAEPHPGLDAGFLHATIVSGRATTADGCDTRIGRTRTVDRRTRAAGTYEWCVVRTGRLELVGGARPVADGATGPPLASLAEALASTRADDVAALLGRQFDEVIGMNDLLREQQRRILERVSGETVERVETVLESLRDEHRPLLREMESMGMPPPPAMRAIAEQVVNRRALDLLRADPFDASAFEQVVTEARRTGAALDGARLALSASEAARREIERWASRPGDDTAFDRALAACRTIRALPFDVDLRLAQDRFWSVARSPESVADERSNSLGSVLGIAEPDA